MLFGLRYEWSVSAGEWTEEAGRFVAFVKK
jgi:hypothetical protein